MELVGGFRSKNEIKMKRLKREAMGSNDDTLLIVKLPTSLVLRVMSRSLFLAMILLALPSIVSFFRGSSSSLYDPETIGSRSINLDMLPLLFHDLGKEGLLNKADRALILSSDVEEWIDYYGYFEEYEIDLVIESDLGSKSMIPDEAFDVVFTMSSGDGKFEDRILKIGGLLVVKLSDDPSNAFHQHSNYKIVYIRRFNSTVVAMKKMGSPNELVNTEQKIPSCRSMLEAKKEVLKGLEAALLEPPHRQALAKSSSKTIKFLPDILEVSLENYSRRIFIHVMDENDSDGVLKWFHQNYPKKNQHFEVYNLQSRMHDVEKMNDLVLFGRGIKMSEISDWFEKNVREEDFVVMKAEAQVVEGLMRENTICLVDELFLECGYEWQGVWKDFKGKKAYWECLALFGRLRDEGLAVHQWWG